MSKNNTGARQTVGGHQHLPLQETVSRTFGDGPGCQMGEAGNTRLGEFGRILARSNGVVGGDFGENACVLAPMLMCKEITA